MNGNGHVTIFGRDHLFTIQDFLDWVETAGVHIVKSYVFIEGHVRELKEAADKGEDSSAAE